MFYAFAHSSSCLCDLVAGINHSRMCFNSNSRSLHLGRMMYCKNVGGKKKCESSSFSPGIYLALQSFSCHSVLWKRDPKMALGAISRPDALFPEFGGNMQLVMFGLSSRPTFAVLHSIFHERNCETHNYLCKKKWATKICNFEVYFLPIKQCSNRILLS